MAWEAACVELPFSEILTVSSCCMTESSRLRCASSCLAPMLNQPPPSFRRSSCAHCHHHHHPNNGDARVKTRQYTQERARARARAAGPRGAAAASERCAW